MWKKLLLSVFALGLAAAANTHLCCTVWVDGQRLDDLYSPPDCDRANTAALAAAEEIMPGQASLPQLSRSYGLSLSPPGGLSRDISQALLDSSPGIERGEGVYVGEEYLGSVDDREQLLSRLRSFIMSQLPTWAESGYLSRQVRTVTQYGRQGSHTPVDDMVLLISGVAPVMYSDGSGFVSRV